MMKKVTLRTLIAYLEQEQQAGRDVSDRLHRAESDAYYCGEDFLVEADVPAGIQTATRIYSVDISPDKSSITGWAVYNNSTTVIWSKLYANIIHIKFPSHKAARAFVEEMGRAYGVAPTDRVFTHY